MASPRLSRLVVAALLLGAALAGCADPEPSPVRPPPHFAPPLQDPSTLPNVPQIDRTSLVPLRWDSARMVGLRDGLRPSCPAATIGDSGAGFRPAAPAPHEVDYDGPYGCALVAGATAAVEGMSFRVNATTWPGITLSGPASLDGDPIDLGGALVRHWTANGSFEATFSEPHAVTATAIDLPLAAHRLEAQVTGVDDARWLARLTNEQALAGNATVVTKDGATRQGTLALLPGVHDIGGVGRTTLGHRSYVSTGEEARATFVDVVGLRVDGHAFDGEVGLHGERLTLALGDSMRLGLAVDQVWRGGVPLLQAELEVEVAPGRLIVRESSGNASLEHVRVLVEDPSAQDLLFVNGTMADLLERAYGLFVGTYTFGVHDPLVFQTIRLAPGEAFEIAVDAQGRWPASVSSANGGSWEGEVEGRSSPPS